MKNRALTAGLALGGLTLCTLSHAEVLINETDADQTSTDTGEFVELYDGGTGNTSLTGLTVVLYNGSSDTSYNAIPLDGYTTDADGYFVLCGDSSQVANCDLDLIPDSNLIQNGQDAIALYAAASDDFPNGTAVTTTDLIDAVVYDTNDADDPGLLVLLNTGQPQLNENMNGAKDTQSLQRCSGGARDTEGFVAALPTPGEANDCELVVEPVLGSCGDPSTAISAIQGSISDINNDATPLLGEVHVVEAIVTMDKQGGNLANGEYSYQYSGFWLQTADGEDDGDAMTSEGLFVYDYSNAVAEGDRVRLMGTVGEYNNVTQLSSITDLSVCSSGNALPASTDIIMPVSDLNEWEALEGMRVTTTQELVISDLYGTGYGFGNYGQFVVSSELHFQGTEIALPGSAEALAADGNRILDTLLVDDGVSAAYPEFIPFPDDSGFAASNPVRIGYTTLAGMNGVMHAYRDNYTLVPATVTIDPLHQRTLEPIVDAGSNLVIAGMNVLNYFNGDGEGGGFPTSRGAPTLDAFDMQSAKIVAALDAIDADIIGLMELENDGFDALSAIQTLTDELNAQQTEGSEYAFINPGVAVIGTDEITVGLLYRPAVVTPQGAAQILDSSNSPLDDDGIALFDDDKNRPALIQTFAVNGQTLTIAVNHLKSKGSACGEDNEGADGQGNCNVSRTRAAQALAEFLGDEQTLILGDLNAYSQEDPMQVFYDAGFSNLKYTDASTEAQPYSYSFSGMLGSLDHALATAPLASQVLSVDAWHINSVEDSLVDYLTEDNGQPYSSVDNYADADAYRSSDHDPIVVGLYLAAPNSAPEQDDDLPVIEVVYRFQSLSADLSGYFSDADGDSLTFTATGLPSGLTLSSDGILSGMATPAVVNLLPAEITLEVSDGEDSVSAPLSIVDNTLLARLMSRLN